MTTMYYQIFGIVLFWGLALATQSETPMVLTTFFNKKANSRVGIYDGKPTTISKHPYMVGLMASGEFRCAAVIVSSNYVLVLGDCAEGQTVAGLTVVASSEDGTSGGTSYSISKIIMHPKYTLSLDYDFALLEVNGTFTWGTTVGKVTLPSKTPTAGTSLVVSGWGDSSSDEGVSEGVLLQGKMKVLTKQSCEKFYSAYTPFTFTDRLGCAYNKGKTTCCQGDFGDPFMKKDVLYGLFAAGGENMCSKDSLPSIYANVYSVVDWIQSYIST